MLLCTHRSWIALAGALAFFTAAPLAVAQSTDGGFRPLPPQNAPPANSITSVGAPQTVPGPTFQSVPVSPYPYYPGYTPYSPTGAALNGMANVYNAQGQYQMQYQQSQLVNQQVKQSAIDTRRKNFNEWQYEQANTPTLEDYRMKSQAEALRRARNDPYPSEIWNGTALNDLLKNIQRDQAQVNGMGPTVPISPSLLKQVNLTAGTTVGSLGLLRNDAKFDWPMVLRGADYAADVKTMNELAPKALQEAQKGQVTMETINTWTETVTDLQSKIDDNVAKLTPTQFTQARRYLRELADTAQALQGPNVSKFANSQWVAKGDSVGELVSFLSSQGLSFAPATNGGEPAYTALYNAMVNYDMGMSRMLAGH